MSTDSTPHDPDDPTQADVEEIVEQHRDLYEDLAASDLPIAEDYRALLDYVDSQGGNDHA